MVPWGEKLPPVIDSMVLTKKNKHDIFDFSNK